MLISMDTTLSRDGEMLYAPVGTEEAVMLSVKAGSYYGLNAVARRIWELLEAPNTLPALRDVICAEFEVDVETCEADLLKFVRELMDNGLVHGAQA